MGKKKQEKQETEVPQCAAIEICNIPISEIHPSDENPRKDMDEDSVRDLAESIRQYGVLQPVTIRPDEEEVAPSPWVMVSGHRRLLACKMLGMETIPAIIRDDISDDKAFDIMIIENLQRKDLSPLDEATAYEELLEPYPVTGYPGTTIQELAARFGKSEKYIKGRVSLNDLVPELKECLKAGSLTIGAAISLSALSMDQQLEFYKDYTPTVSKNDSDTVISPMSISDVKDFIVITSDRILDQSFAEDADESWNTGRFHKCAGCPFNSASQGALFVDMVEPGNCSNESCLNDKILAYARHIFDYWYPNIKNASQFLEPGDMVLLISKTPWFRGTAKKEKQKLYDTLCRKADELGSFNTSKNGGRIWNTDDDSRKDAIRVLNLQALVNGERDYIQYYRILKKTKDPLSPPAPEHGDIYRKLGALYDKRQEEIYKALEPMSKTAVETYFNTDNPLHLPTFLENFVAYHLINEMSWQNQRELIGSDTSLKAVQRFMGEHSFSEVLRAAILDRIVNGQQYYRPYLLQMIMEGCAEQTVADTIKDIKNKFQPKINNLILTLRNMGYDEHDNPLPDNDESPEAAGEQESNEQES